jgi:hypothetical protein
MTDLGNLGEGLNELRKIRLETEIVLGCIENLAKQPKWQSLARLAAFKILHSTLLTLEGNSELRSKVEALSTVATLLGDPATMREPLERVWEGPEWSTDILEKFRAARDVEADLLALSDLAKKAASLPIVKSAKVTIQIEGQVPSEPQPLDSAIQTLEATPALKAAQELSSLAEAFEGLSENSDISDRLKLIVDIAEKDGFSDKFQLLMGQLLATEDKIYDLMGALERLREHAENFVRLVNTAAIREMGTQLNEIRKLEARLSEQSEPQNFESEILSLMRSVQKIIRE